MSLQQKHSGINRVTQSWVQNRGEEERGEGEFEWMGLSVGGNVSQKDSSEIGETRLATMYGSEREATLRVIQFH